MLDERRSSILRVLVEEYTRSGQPVSSRAISESSGLGVSSATIRNELAGLEREGFVAQPHTSAGRVPTDLGYRYYVDHLSPIRLRTSTHSRIVNFFSSVHRELDALLQETSDLVADITHYPAVVLGPGLGADTIHGVNLVRLGPEVVMLVLVASSGRVVKEIARLPRAVSPEQVAGAERLLVDALCGQPVAQAIERVAALPGRRSREVGLVMQTAAEAAQRSAEQTQDLYMGGTSQLAGLWADLDKLHRILEYLERESVMQLLESAADGTSVRIGSELPVPSGTDLAVVSRSFEMGQSGTGQVGVFGPKRMDYRRTIRVVEEVGDGLGDTLGR